MSPAERISKIAEAKMIVSELRDDFNAQQGQDDGDQWLRLAAMMSQARSKLEKAADEVMDRVRKGKV